VAIKILPPQYSWAPERYRRFEQEARAAGQINHPNILAVYDIGTHAGSSYIVSELLEGESLGSRLRGGALPARKGVDYARQTTEGLAAAHDKGLVHRDLKPDNLFITKDGRVKILDFGIAKLTLPSDEASRPTGFATETAAGMVVGSAGYMSPEQVRGEAVDARSDIFSFGAVFYEMLSGRPAFVRGSGPETMAAVLKEDPPDPIDTKAPAAIAQIISRCLEKTREARFQSARDLAFALQFLGGTSGTAATLTVAARRRRPALSVVIVALSILAAIASWLPWRTLPVPIEDVLAHSPMSLLTDWDGAEEGAEISPDGKLVAFLSDYAGEWDIWFHQIGTDRFTNLTENFPPLAASGFIVRKLGFSADSSEIWFNPGDGQALMSMPWGSGKPHAFLPAGTNTPAFSPVNGHVLYVDKAAGDELYLSDRNGADPRSVLGASPLKNMNPAYSQDGQWIYFARGVEPQDELAMDVWRLPAAGGTPERLSTQHLAINFLAPFDARTLLYVARAEDRSGPWLWAFDVDRKSSRRIPMGVHHFTSISTSRDGQRVVATVSTPSASLWSVPLGARLMKEEDARPFPMSAPTGQAMAPRFGENALFYLSGLGTRDGLWRDRSGQATDIWRGGDGALSEPAAISPDASRVVVVVRREGKRHLTIMNADGTGARTLAGSIEIDGAAGQGAADWAPDGKRVVTAGHDEQGPALFIIDVETGAARRLLAGAWTNPVWSPKGDLIVCRSTRSVLGQVTVRAVKEQDGTVIELPFMTRPGGYRFLPNGSGLVYLPRIQGFDFWLYEFATGNSHQIAQLENKGALRTFDITRDGKSIVFDRSRQNSNVVLIDVSR